MNHDLKNILNCSIPTGVVSFREACSVAGWRLAGCCLFIVCAFADKKCFGKIKVMNLRMEIGGLRLEALQGTGNDSMCRSSD